MDCNYRHEGCKGGTQPNAIDFVIKNGGLASETDYPYTGIPTACANNKPSSLSSKITGIGYISENNETSLLEAVANQSVSVDVDLKICLFNLDQLPAKRYNYKYTIHNSLKTSH